MHTVLFAIVFLPLLGALIAGLFGTKVFKGLGRDADVYGAHAHAHDGHHAHADHGHGDHSHDDHGHHAHYDGPRWPMYLTTALLVVSAILSWYVFIGFMHEPRVEKVELLRWINSGALSINWMIRVDTLTAVMLVVVNTVSALVHIYSLGYMSHDEQCPPKSAGQAGHR